MSYHTDPESWGSWDTDSLEVPILEEGLASLQEELFVNEQLPGLNLKEATALILDVNNLYKAARYHGFRIDYTKLRAMFDNRCNLRHCTAIGATNQNDPLSMDWVAYMKSAGYVLITKDLRIHTLMDGTTREKGNMDVEITIDAMGLSPAFTHIVLGTCDSDFIPLIKSLKNGKQRTVSVLGVSNNSQVSVMSSDLVKEADNFYDLSKLIDYISFEGSRGCSIRS
jgi:uncharacterized LabA/DUF88 family protein